LLIFLYNFCILFYFDAACKFAAKSHGAICPDPVAAAWQVPVWAHTASNYRPLPINPTALFVPIPRVPLACSILFFRPSCSACRVALLLLVTGAVTGRVSARPPADVSIELTHMPRITAAKIGKVAFLIPGVSIFA